MHLDLNLMDLCGIHLACIGLGGSSTSALNSPAAGMISNPDSGKRKAKHMISKQNLVSTKQNTGFQNKTWETESETKDFGTKPGNPEHKARGNRKQNKGFRNKTMESGTCRKETESATRETNSRSEGNQNSNNGFGIGGAVFVSSATRVTLTAALW